MYTEISTRGDVIVGTKQVLRALDSSSVSRVFVADDMDAFAREKIMNALRGKDVDIVHVASMKELGKACKIDVGTAVAAVPG